MRDSIGRFAARMAGIALAATLTAAPACGSQASAAQELRVPMSGDPSTLDPTQQLYQNDADVTRSVFEALTRVKPDLTDVEAAAASSWTVSQDGLTWTFNLRADGKFSDGTPVTATNFVYSYKRILDPTVASGNADPFYDQTIAGAADYPNINPKDPTAVQSFLNGLGLSAPDSHTFVVRLQHPAPYFKWLSSLFVAAPLEPSEVLAAGSARFGAVSAAAPHEVIGNGPFRIAELEPKDHITLVPNPFYRAQPTLQKVILREMSAEAAYLAYRNGELDLSVVPVADSSVSAKSSELVRVPVLETQWLQFNTARAPFDNADVRLAFTESIDRNAYVNDVLRGRGIPALTLIPKGMTDFRPDLGSAQAFNLTAARSNLASSGLSVARLNAMNLTYIFSGGSTSKTIAEFLQSQFQTNLGVNVALIGLDGKSMHSKERNGEFTLQGLTGWIADYPDSEDFFDNFVSSASTDWTRFANREFDSAVSTADTTTDTHVRDRLYAEAESVLVDQAPVAFLDQPETWWLVKPYVKNLIATPIDDFIGDFHLGSIQIAAH